MKSNEQHIHISQPIEFIVTQDRRIVDLFLFLFGFILRFVDILLIHVTRKIIARRFQRKSFRAHTISIWIALDKCFK